MNFRANITALRPRGRLPLGTLYELLPLTSHGEQLVKSPFFFL